MPLVPALLLLSAAAAEPRIKGFAKSGYQWNLSTQQSNVLLSKLFEGRHIASNWLEKKNRSVE